MVLLPVPRAAHFQDTEQLKLHTSTLVVEVIMAEKGAAVTALIGRMVGRCQAHTTGSTGAATFATRRPGRQRSKVRILFEPG